MNIFIFLISVIKKCSAKGVRISENGFKYILKIWKERSNLLNFLCKRLVANLNLEASNKTVNKYLNALKWRILIKVKKCIRMQNKSSECK